MALLLQLNKGVCDIFQFRYDMLVRIPKLRPVCSFRGFPHPAMLAAPRKTGAILSAPIANYLCNKNVEERIVGR